jgi:hypothetical protein
LFTLWSVSTISIQRFLIRFHSLVGSVIDDLSPPFCGLFNRGEIHAIDPEIACMHALLHSDAGWIDGEHLRRHHEVVVIAIVFLLDSLRFDPSCDTLIVVVFRDEMECCLSTFPLTIQFISNILQTVLVSTAVANQNDVLEPMHAVALTHVGQQWTDRPYANWGDRFDLRERTQ